MTEKIECRGATIYPDYLTMDEQVSMVQALRDVVARAPLVTPQTAQGAMSVRMTSMGRYGWVSDGHGYRYARRHPSGMPWPDIPDCVLRVWEALSNCARAPECGLVNYYDASARMGLHQDRDEADFSCPVVSISLGDEGLFRIGNHDRGGKTQSIWLRSGDVVVLGGDARLRYHGVDRIRPGTTSVLAQPGRLNVTLRVVT